MNYIMAFSFCKERIIKKCRIARLPRELHRSAACYIVR